jgi:hypothetical protein
VGCKSNLEQLAFWRETRGEKGTLTIKYSGFHLAVGFGWLTDGVWIIFMSFWAGGENIFSFFIFILPFRPSFFVNLRKLIEKGMPKTFKRVGKNKNKKMKINKIFSFDAETNGLWGKAFSIAALVYENGIEIARFIGRCPIEGETNGWVAENVLPKMTDIAVTHGSYDEMVRAFAEFYLANKADATVIAHMGFIVEVKLLRDAHDLGFIGDWDAPYPLIDIAGNLQQAGEDPTSVDDYVQKHGLKVRDFGTTHNPLYDSEVAAVVFQHLQI